MVSVVSFAECAEIKQMTCNDTGTAIAIAGPRYMQKEPKSEQIAVLEA